MVVGVLPTPAGPPAKAKSTSCRFALQVFAPPSPEVLVPLSKKEQARQLAATGLFLCLEEDSNLHELALTSP